MSHTTKIVVQYLSESALRQAVENLSGQWIGQGNHRLYSEHVQGIGFQLSGWRYPCILQKDGSLAMDIFEGRWGNHADIDKLTGEYALCAATEAAQAQGWYCERHGDCVAIHHPDGGIIYVDAFGCVDATSFTGSDCVSACAPIEGAIGTQSERTLKPSFYEARQHIKITE